MIELEHKFLRMRKEKNNSAWWENDNYNTTYHPTIDFYSKYSYQKWVKEWKNCYKWLSEEIRKAKVDSKNLYSKGKGHEGWKKGLIALKGRELANQLLALRHEAKEISWQMKQEKSIGYISNIWKIKLYLLRCRQKLTNK